MDKKIDSDFWYRDLPFTGLEVTGYRKFAHNLSDGIGPSLLKDNFIVDFTKNDPLDYWDKYNIFTFHNEQMYDLLQHIKPLVLKACNELGIDYDKQKYHIHGWMDIYNGEFNDTDINNLNWYEESTQKNVFSGMFMFEAEDSFNYYLKNGEILEVENVAGRLHVFTNHKWFHGKWTDSYPKRIFGFNIYPIALLPDIEEFVARYIPL